ncbi:hypothetical protein [Larkinella soli]|uniref:hypothetical protein n=1 Tax=Larkinella soli TaxID=1770527 RepID=UPI0013E3232D|nr:hypothetical protein [Larkinella soli]
MKDFLLAAIPTTLFVVLYFLVSEEGDIEGPNWPIIAVTSLTFSLVVYFILKVMRRKSK